MSNQAGWECDACRKAGLEKKRRCTFVACGEASAGAPPVWARKGVALWTCPKGYISAESLALIENFLVRRRVRAGFAELSAREADAFAVLEDLVGEEITDGHKSAAVAAR